MLVCDNLITFSLIRISFVFSDIIKSATAINTAAAFKKISKKGRKFYGCSAYAKCDFASPGIPTGEKCNECGGYIISGVRNRKYCMNSECPSRNSNTQKEK